MNTLKIFLFMLELSTHFALLDQDREGFDLEMVTSPQGISARAGGAPC